MKLIDLLKPPCPQCPYTLGQVKFIDNPCPNCKLNNYQMYHVLAKDKYIYLHRIGSSRGGILNEEYKRACSASFNYGR